MKLKTLVSVCMLVLTAITAQAQDYDDITQYYLQNALFDTNFNYTASQTGNVAQEMLSVDGWTNDYTMNYTIVGVYQIGTKTTFNGASVPAINADGTTEGGVLALSTGWEESIKLNQSVSLPAGKYKLVTAYYNGDASKTAGKSLFGWIPSSGTSTMSTVSSFACGKWITDTLTFTLTATRTGKIQIGFQAAANGSANSAKISVDYVKLLAADMAVNKTALNSALTTANNLYGDGTGNGAAELKAAIDAAQAVYDDASVTMLTVLQATKTLNEAIDAYRKLNISEDNPLDCTQYIKNPSFEVGGMANWIQENMQSQTNTSFTKKAGSTYVEKWVGSGNVGDASISQVITVPNGKYKLTVAAQNLRQSNATQKCTGAYIYAGDQQTMVYTPADYSVTFTSISGELEIGFRAVGATGNWLCVDNFRLYQIGEVDANAVLAELQRIIQEGEALQTSMMSNKAKNNLEAALTTARAITVESPETDIQGATKALSAAIEAAKQSIAEYAALQTAIEAAENAYDSSKEGAADFLAVINEAKELVQNGEATSDQLAAEIVALQNAELLFMVANGSGTAPKATTSTSFYIPAAHGALIRATFSGSSFKERGICWSTEPEPTIADHRTTDYYNQKGMLFHIKDMQPASVYYARAYAITNTYAVGYGEVMKIVTLPKGSCVGTWDYGAPTEEANTRCNKAIQETMDYLNEWTAIKGFTLSGHYGSGTPTADCSYGGWMRIGPNAAYQAIGTVLHETGHGVGVGTTARWSNNSDLRENTTSGKWLGSWANKTLRFLENTNSLEVFLTGDGTHGWGSTAAGSSQTISYDWFVNGADKDKHTAIQYIGGCALLYSLYIDGLCPTSNYSNGVPGYTFNFEEGKKYYIKSESEDLGLNDGYVCERRGSQLRWTKLTTSQLTDSCAWYVEYVPSSGYYRFRNVATGKYITHSSTTPSLTSTNNPGSNQNIQLMPGRVDVTIGKTAANKMTLPTFWMTWNSNGDKALQIGNYLNSLGAGQLTIANFNFATSAKNQHYVFVSEDDIKQFEEIAYPDGIISIKADEGVGAAPTVMGIFTTGGMRIDKPVRGLNVIRYSDGTSRVIIK